ncbi:hypothetical protein IX329_000377 [Fusobacterium necrophorum]|uniref:hypothetical protein n=1 Tax=Fusobacterium necrophorum TaxID=859 RepID=UPI000B16ECC7|nr:hypothetical protein [Fusobacterium necrophorum]MBR8732806.1 hypothetical protein [Fusobacterium necrophorum]MBR8788983.1 hypothetical protein [Fusobacterium necrophorum]MBR8823047.1 hypothetical protein [Fusobacterium necrophorum]
MDMYTDSKLEQINGTPELDKCIKELFSVNNYINRIEYLDGLLEDFKWYHKKILRMDTK